MAVANFPWVESPFFEEVIKEKKLSESDKKLAEDYHRDGFVVLQNMVPHELIDQVVTDMNEKGFNPSFEIKTQRDHLRIQDMWKVSKASKDLAAYTPVLEKLEMLYDREAIPFQTLNFRQGSGQRAHSDTIHFSSLPARYMCGVWVALEDITEENGPLFYYPGSHRLTEYNFAHIDMDSSAATYDKYVRYEDFIMKVIEANKFEKRIFLAKKGDVLIWSSNILHGGTPLINPDSTRYSQVTHYFFRDCVYYTPMLSNMVTNELFIRDHLQNIRTGEIVKQTYNGKTISSYKTKGKLSVLSEHRPWIKRRS